MAKFITKSSFDGLSGKIGPYVTYISNGIQIVRARPESNKKRKLSELQKLHIRSFKARHAFARNIKRSIIDRIWSQMTIPVGMNPYNYFFKCNNDAFGKTDHIAFPQLVTLSSGKLLPVENLKVDVANNKLSLSWISKINYGYSNADDRLTIAVLSKRNSLQIIDTSFIRSDEKAELELGELNTDIIEGFVFWASSNDKVFSRTDYWCYLK